MPRRKDPELIDWLKSEARIVLLEDLGSGVLPLNEDELSTEDAWEVYKDHPAFVDLVVFKQFKKQLKAHCEQVSN